ARRRMDQMAAFSAVASTVNEWVDVEQLARRFLAVFLNTTATNYGLFYLLESDEEMRLLAQFGVPSELVEGVRLGRLSLHPDLQRVMARGRLLIIDDVQPAQFSATATDLALMLQVNTVALLPLRVKGRGIGVVVLGQSEGRIEIADREFVQGLADQAAQAIENARLFAESQRRFEEQSALRELAQRFLSAVSPDEVIERTLDALVSLLPADYYEVLLPDAEGTFVLYNGRGWRRGVVGRTRTVSDPHLHAGYALRAQSPVIIENFSYETRFQAADYLMRHQVVAGVCAPMLAETRVIGLLGVYSRASRHFTEEQSHFLYLVATQTAIALEKARHSQDAARRLDELILLNDVIVAANSEISLDKVLKSITNQIGELLGSDNVQLYFAAENAGVLQLRPALDRAGRAGGANWSKALADWVVRTGEPILIQDLARDLRFNVTAPEAHACLGAPMTIGDRVIGVIAVAQPEVNTFDNNDLRLLTTLAGQTAAAIERARLLDETAKRLAEISAMFELSNELRTATTESRLMDLVIHAGVEMLQGEIGSLQLLSEDGTALQVCAVHNMDDLGLSMPRASGGLSWEVYETGESLAIPDLKSDPRTFLPDRFKGVHSSIIAPLRTPSGILGTMFVGFAESGEPGQDKVRLATTIANLAAQSLQRLRLHEQTVEQAASLAAALDELETSYQATLLALSAALDARDRETEGHSQRVTKFALAIGRQLNLSADELTSLERGALLHDVGKIGVSDNILLKAGPLTPEERALMNTHPQLGYEMLKDIPFLQDALPVVLHHQEMYDGSGYPAGLRGEEIPLGARIFAVADTYDAMTSKRPYRNALSHERALAEIVRCRGTQFDPKVVDAFVSLFKEPKRDPRIEFDG
ncbi:MAG TPA: GAF domain-containing protein, partial [Anaerolineae bacterium]|nr:GAF domain-containing protein [Anaerolineae bacterium]